MTVPWVPSGTPYITPDLLAANVWPTSVDFTTIPPGTNVLQAQKTAALADICMSATASVNGEMNYPLHSVLNTEQLQGPNYRVTVHNSTKEGRVILSRWPVTSIQQVQVAPAGVYPLQWTTVPSGFYRIEYPVIGHYNSNTAGGSGEGGQAILIAPGYVNWCNGRWGVVVSVKYTHGWPHTEIATAPAAGAGTLAVTDCTGWGPFTAGQPGAEGIVYDATGNQEAVMVTASTATSGPGTLTLASPLAYAHAANLMVSSLPSDVIWATVLFAAAEALTRGAQATVVQSVPGHGAGLTGADALRQQACHTLSRFRRTI